jgi:hypothetical protein
MCRGEKVCDLIIKAHQTIPSSVLESFQIIYLMPTFRGINQIRNKYSTIISLEQTMTTANDFVVAI